MQILENYLLTVTKQLRFPRSKKRRIQKKWRKRPGNIQTVPDRNCFVVGNRLICHPVVAAELRAAIKTEAKAQCYGVPTAMQLIRDPRRPDPWEMPIYGPGIFNGSWT